MCVSNRRMACLATAAAMVIASAVHAAEPITLSTVPAPVYKNRDSGRANSESWVFNLVVTDAKNRKDLRAVKAEIGVFAGTVLRETTIIPEASLERMRATSYQITPETDSLSLQRRAVRDETFDVRLRFVSKPIGWQADRVHIALTLSLPGMKNFVESIDVPLTEYAQKTSLVFPLKAPSIVTQGQFNNLGHAGHSNQFAIDVMALNKEYGPMVDGKDGNDQFVAFGTEVVAPAAGKVVYARNDVPDNPPDTDPVTVYSKVHDALMATAGNCIVIDHGNGEFSALMHLQRGSVSVAVGSEVKQGQAIARLGCSGDAYQPHLHYQLQDGAELFRAVSLPVKFDNLQGTDLGRGNYLTPR